MKEEVQRRVTSRADSGAFAEVVRGATRKSLMTLPGIGDVGLLGDDKEDRLAFYYGEDPDDPDYFWRCAQLGEEVSAKIDLGAGDLKEPLL